MTNDEAPMTKETPNSNAECGMRNLRALSGIPHSAFRTPHSQSAVALIITLIMLAMITVMAVAFLALSRRERASVTQSVNSMDAEFMTSAGWERAKAEILAHIVLNSNFLGPGLLVSGMRTNYAANPQD